jgi:hypothetical protein
LGLILGLTFGPHCSCGRPRPPLQVGKVPRVTFIPGSTLTIEFSNLSAQIRPQTPPKKRSQRAPELGQVQPKILVKLGLTVPLCIFLDSLFNPFGPHRDPPLAHLYKSRCAFLGLTKKLNFRAIVCNHILQGADARRRVRALHCRFEAKNPDIYCSIDNYPGNFGFRSQSRPAAAPARFPPLSPLSPSSPPPSRALSPSLLSPRLAALASRSSAPSVAMPRCVCCVFDQIARSGEGFREA